MQRKTFQRGPGLLYIIAVLVVVALAAARFLGFSPGAGTPEPPGQTAPGDGVSERKVLPDPSRMTEVLVFHTHTSENYTPGDPFSTRGPGDVVRVGESFANALSAEGVGAVHVQTVHDLPEWSAAYSKARASIQDSLARHSGIRLLVDIHRDAVESAGAPGYASTMINGVEVARILFVVGSTDNPLAQENVRYAQRLQEVLEEMAPGITRGVRVMARETNQDLHPRSVVAYVGDHKDNTAEEAARAAEWLAKAVVQLLREDG